jgi:hypothetical protein
VLTGEQTPDKLDDFTPVAWSASAFSRSSHKSARGSAEHLHHMGRKKADPERQLTVHHQPQRREQRSRLLLINQLDAPEPLGGCRGC